MLLIGNKLNSLQVGCRKRPILLSSFLWIPRKKAFDTKPSITTAWTKAFSNWVSKQTCSKNRAVPKVVLVVFSNHSRPHVKPFSREKLSLKAFSRPPWNSPGKKERTRNCQLHDAALSMDPLGKLRKKAHVVVDDETMLGLCQASVDSKYGHLPPPFIPKLQPPRHHWKENWIPTTRFHLTFHLLFENTCVHYFLRNTSIHIHFLPRGCRERTPSYNPLTQLPTVGNW